ncbi:Hypothetical protein HEAR0931 [Herminiimonas arsenicoxydans]|uniref:Uncharacterized protein n=1 Tax=Herminiimonas arsenicoxydans TaxID=204773 RepID=A4G3M8_HERAR|nr:Hypothetical protein HEAR0931 [Herminiimonas arsenicoxydans]
MRGYCPPRTVNAGENIFFTILYLPEAGILLINMGGLVYRYHLPNVRLTSPAIPSLFRIASQST